MGHFILYGGEQMTRKTDAKRVLVAFRLSVSQARDLEEMGRVAGSKSEALRQLLSQAKQGDHSLESESQQN
jgi:hypothetical protein